MQVRAIFEAACTVAARKGRVMPEVMIPLYRERGGVPEAGADRPTGGGGGVPRAPDHRAVPPRHDDRTAPGRLTADELAREAQFFSYGTNASPRPRGAARRRRPLPARLSRARGHRARPVPGPRSGGRRQADPDGGRVGRADAGPISSWASAASTGAIRPPWPSATARDELCQLLPFRIPSRGWRRRKPRWPSGVTPRGTVKCARGWVCAKISSTGCDEADVGAWPAKVVAAPTSSISVVMKVCYPGHGRGCVGPFRRQQAQHRLARLAQAEAGGGSQPPLPPRISCTNRGFSHTSPLHHVRGTRISGGWAGLLRIIHDLCSLPLGVAATSARAAPGSGRGLWLSLPDPAPPSLIPACRRRRRSPSRKPWPHCLWAS